jgi:hypothetical protein
MLVAVGAVLTAWFGLGLPPTGGPAVKVSSGSSDIAFGVAYPYLALVFVGLGLLAWGIWVLASASKPR